MPFQKTLQAFFKTQSWTWIPPASVVPPVLGTVGFAASWALHVFAVLDSHVGRARSAGTQRVCRTSPPPGAASFGTPSPRSGG